MLIPEVFYRPVVWQCVKFHLSWSRDCSSEHGSNYSEAGRGGKNDLLARSSDSHSNGAHQQQAMLMYKSYRIPSDMDSQISLPRSYTLPREFRYYRRPKSRKAIRSEHFVASTNSSDGRLSWLTLICMLAIKVGGSYRCEQRMTAINCKWRYALLGNTGPHLPKEEIYSIHSSTAVCMFLLWSCFFIWQMSVASFGWLILT
jgi:hypothetical protein